MGTIADWTCLRKKISDIDNTSIETFKTEKQRKKMGDGGQKRIFKNQGTTTKSVTNIIRIPEGEERGKETEGIFKVIMTGNFPKLVSDTNSQIEELREHQER